ncbi:MAG TPA: AMP-binding protein [Candidatus Dormibacteraeota bacterium]
MTAAGLASAGAAPLLLSAGGDVLLTYAGAEAASDELAESLRPAARPGDVVSCVLPNGPAFVVTLLAVRKLGAVLAPLGVRLPEAERGRLLERLRPTVLVSRGDAGVPPAAAASVAWEDPPRVEVVRARRPAGPASELSPTAGDALVLFTSGSTGAPKGVLLTAAAVDVGSGSVAARCALSPADRTVALLPWTHGHGLIGVLLSTMRSGGSVVVGPAGPAAANLELALDAPGVTWVSVVPPQLAALCELARDRPPPSWRFVRTASAPLSAALGTRAEATFGCPVAEAYGMTETAHEAAANEPAFTARRLGTVGVPSALRFRTGEPAGGGHLLEVSGPSLFRGYLDDGAATGRALEGGWYRTQDIGAIDPDGRIRLLGRLSDLINRMGNKVSPVEIEEALARHPDVVASLATRVPDERVGEEIGVVVVRRPDSALSAEDLERHCRALLAPYKIPRVVRFVEDVPRLDNGKPSRALAMHLLLSDGG